MTLLANINVGSSPNDGTGDSLRTSFITCNENFQILDTLATEFTSGNLNANITSNGTSTFNNVNISGNVISSGNITSNYFLGNGSALTNVAAATANSATYAAQVTGNTQANITTVGTLGNLTVTGTILTNLIEGATIGNSGASLVGSITTASQPNITSLGTLTNLSMASGSSINDINSLIYRTDAVFDVTNSTANVQFWSNQSLFNGINVNSTLTVNYPTPIEAGIQKTFAIKNSSGSTQIVNLPNGNNNKGSNSFTIANSVTATVTFFSYDTTEANIVAMIIND